MFQTERRCLIALALASVIAVGVLVSQGIQSTRPVRLTPSNNLSAEHRLCLFPKWKPDSSAPQTEAFHPLTDDVINGSVCVLAFSAFFDKRKMTVEIITDANKACYDFASTPLSCLIWYLDRDRPYLSQLRLGYVTTHSPYRKPRQGVVYSCPVDADAGEDPYAVTVLSPKKECHAVANATTLKVYYPDSLKHTFAVCTPPLFGKIDPLKFIEFIEMHLLLGAEKFYFYNASISAAIVGFLSRYVKDGIVQVIQWQSLYPSEVFYNNQGIMQIDCLYRNLNKAKYVAQMDVDEVLMPRQAGANWSSLTAKRFTNDTAALMFLNRFYSNDKSAQCPGSNVSSKADPSITYLNRLTYYNESYKPSERSKVLYSPERVLYIWTHFATPYPRYKVKVLDPSEGVLQHYRSSSTRFNSTTADYHMCSFKKILLQRARERLSLV